MMARFYSDVRWFLRQIGAQFVEHGLLTSAAALTYTTLFAVVPLMTVGYFMLSVLPIFSGVGEQIQGFVFENFVPESSVLIQERLSDFSSQAQGLTVAGVLILVGTAFMMLVTVEQAFNRIWQVNQPRRGLPRFLVYWAVLTCGPPLLAGGLLISSYLISLPLLSDMDTFGFRETILAFLPVLLSMTGFTVLYYAMPNTRVPFRHALVGGMLTTVAFELAKLLFRETVSRSGMTLIYGTFAAVPLFLVWVYLVWALILAGAIFVRTMALDRRQHESDGEPLLLKAGRMLNLMHDAHMHGRTVSDVDINECVHLTGDERAQVFAALDRLNLLTQTDDKGYTLARNLKTVCLWELYEELPQGLEMAQFGRPDEIASFCEPLREFVGYGVDRLSTTLDEVFDAKDPRPLEMSA